MSDGKRTRPWSTRPDSRRSLASGSRGTSPTILWARGSAALAFAGLAVNAFLPTPELWAIYLCAAWDGLATGVSVTALMAVASTLVRPDQLPAAGALIPPST